MPLRFLNRFLHFSGVPIAGALDHLLPPQMHGVLQLCLQELMVDLVHLAILVAVLHLVEAAHDHQLPVAIELMNLLLVHGGQTLGHHLLLAH